MPTSEAKIAANRQNAARSTGPKTAEGKEKSRANALKHGLTGDGVVLTEADALEVNRLTSAIESEMKPSVTMSRVLIRQFARLAVRLERSAVQETAAIAEHVRQARADFVPPEGVDDAKAEELRTEAGHVALFDPSKEAQLARKYEAAAERGMFRALKEFRQLEREVKASLAAAPPTREPEHLGSFFPVETIRKIGQMARQLETAEPARTTDFPPSKSRNPDSTRREPAQVSFSEVPFTIGKPR